MNCRIEQKEAFEVYGVEKRFPPQDLYRVSEFWEECSANRSIERLPTSGYEKADGPDIEIYGQNYEEVWISVVKSSPVL